MLDFPMKVAWGKKVPLPAVPAYVHHESKEGMTMVTRLPFSAKPKQHGATMMSATFLPTYFSFPFHRADRSFAPFFQFPASAFLSTGDCGRGMVVG
jgi:hypothetical protein